MGKYIVFPLGVLLLMMFSFRDSGPFFLKLKQLSSSSSKQRYLLIQVASGLTNQRLCILYALYHSSLYHYTFVKPNLTQCCHPLYHNRNISAISFDTFYSLKNSMSSISNVDQLPTHHQKECERQLKESQSMEDVIRIAKNSSYYLVQCLNFNSVFLHLNYLLRQRNNVSMDSEYLIGINLSI
jgi:hypothetical protein